LSDAIWEAIGSSLVSITFAWSRFGSTFRAFTGGGLSLYTTRPSASVYL
jgi:hypothetical protein